VPFATEGGERRLHNEPPKFLAADRINYVQTLIEHTGAAQRQAAGWRVSLGGVLNSNADRNTHHADGSQLYAINENTQRVVGALQRNHI
jgi:hypothetical protein